MSEFEAAYNAITARRDAFYSGLSATGGWNITEVTGNKYQDEIDWLTGYIPSADKMLEYSEEYLPLVAAPDFAVNSVYVSTANGQEAYSPVSNMYTNTGFDDVVYDYINGNETARDVLMLNSISDNTAFLGLDKSFLNEMTEDEVSLFNYIYATESADAAYEYIDFISSDLTARQRITESERWTEYAKEHPHIADMTSVMMSPIKGLSYLGQIADYAADGTIDQNAGYNKFSYVPGVIREERGNQVNAKWGKLGGVGEFGYNLLMGMGDFAMNTFASGGYSPLAMLMMGGGAAADTTLAAKNRGLSDDQALVLGAVAGAVEAATEKLSIETLLDPDLMADGFLKYVWKNMVTEGSEEGVSNLLNTFADILISGDHSQWAQNVEKYRSQGYSDAAARERALGDQARSLGLDVLGGMLSGGLLSGGYGGVNAAFNTDGAPKKPRRKNAVVSLANVQVPSYETLTAKPNVPVVDIRKTASGSYAEQRKAFRVSQAAANLYKAPITNRDTGADLFVTPQTFTHTFSNRHNQQENINMAEHMREIIENAVFTHVESSRKAPDDHTTGVYTFFSAVHTEHGVQPVKLKVKEYRLEGQNIPQTVKNFLQRMFNPETYASVYDGNVLVVEAIEKEGTNSSAPSIARDNPATDKHLLAPSEISVKELLSLVKGDASKYVPMSKSHQIQTLTDVAHTPQEKLVLDRYRNAVTLLENRQRILTATQRKLQQLASAGDVHSAEYNRLKSAELSLNRKVDEAQRKVDGLEDGTSIRGLREKAENNTKMAAGNAEANNWDGAIPRETSKSSKQSLVRYAKDRGINIVHLKHFDGDPQLLQAQIDTLAALQNEYSIKDMLTIEVSDTMTDDDFAQLRNNTIVLNGKCLRDRAVTEANLTNSGSYLASTRLEDIIVHEYGHVIARKIGNRGIEFAQQALYNLYGREFSFEETIRYLRSNISQYSVALSQGLPSYKITPRSYKEIIPEVFAKHNYNRNEFTTKFIALIQGELSK